MKYLLRFNMLVVSAVWIIAAWAFVQVPTPENIALLLASTALLIVCVSLDCVS